MEERILAEAELLAGATYRVVLAEDDEYYTEYREGERYTRDFHSTLLKALWDFVDTVINQEIGARAEEIANNRR